MRSVEISKKEREVYFCAVVARAINEREDSDYEVKSATYYLENPEEPFDVVLESRSGTYPPRPIQVVTIPSGQHLELRGDNSNVARFENLMKEIFATRNVDDCELHVGLTERSIFNGVPQIAAAKLADVVDGARCNGNWEIDDEQLYASDRLSDFVSYVHGLSIPSLGLHVHVTLTGWPGRDGAWIDEAITKKAKRYPDRTVAQTALVIGAAWSIDSEHVQSYLASERCATIPFSEAWIVLFGGRAIPLKLRR